MTIAPDPPMSPPTPPMAPPTGDLEDAAERAPAPAVGIAGTSSKVLAWKAERPSLGSPHAPRVVRGDIAAVHLGFVGIGMGQLVLFGRGPGRLDELEGVLLRFVRRGQQHHRRQAGHVTVAAGSCHPRFRSQLVEHLGTRGSHGGCDRRSVVRGGSSLVQPRGRPSRRAGDGIDAGGRTDVSLQQSRRAADSAHDDRGVYGPPRDRRLASTLVRVDRCRDWIRISHETVAGALGRAGVGRSHTCFSANRGSSGGSRISRWPSSR